MICVIPVNCESKRLPGKNFKYMCGRPLFAWTLRTARMFFRPQEIYAVYRGKLPFGAKYILSWGGGAVIPEQPIGLETSAINAVLNVPFTARRGGVLLMQPTYVWRDPHDVEFFLHTVTQPGNAYRNVRTTGKDGEPNGNLYWIQEPTRENLWHSIWLGDGVDINTQEDFGRAEKIMADRLAKAGV